MLKNSKKIAISNHFLISIAFIVLMFTFVGVCMDDVCASDLNQNATGIENELNIEDKLGNSQENILNTNLNEQQTFGVDPNNEISLLNGGKFSDIRDAINSAKKDYVIKLGGTFKAEKEFDPIIIDKRLTIMSDSSATLDGRGLTHIFIVDEGAAKTTLKNLKIINGYRSSTAAGIYVKTHDVKITGCEFKNNDGHHGSAICTPNDNYTARNLLVENCKFIKNHAVTHAGAIVAMADNSRIYNCTFDSNNAYDPTGVRSAVGGAIQIGMDKFRSRGYVYDCVFKNNWVKPTVEASHGGAGCVRDGVEYRNCIFINNSASQGGALTMHASGLIKNCTFINNSALYYGGAVSTGFSDMDMNLKIQNCIFEGNAAPKGGAVQLKGTNIEIINSKFDNNNASQTGGAVNIMAKTVNVADSTFNNNIAYVDGGAIFVTGENTQIAGSSFISNDAIPDLDKLDDGLGGAIYINSSYASIKNNKFYYNTARNGSAIYYDKYGLNLNLTNNILFENQAWVYALPIYAHDIYYGEVENIGSIIHGGNNIGKYNNLSVSNAIYNGANHANIVVDGENPVLGATTNGHLYQDDREYNMNILLTVVHEDGSVVYNKTLNSDCFGEVKDSLKNLKVGKYYVSAKHYEDTYYKGITNTTTFKVTAQADGKIRKSVSSNVIDYRGIVVWTLNIANNGPSNATKLVIRDVLPEGLIYIEDDTNGAYNHATGTLTIDFLEVGEVYTINIKTRVNKTGEITNNANVTAKEYDYNLTNNHDNSTVKVNPACDLAVEKTCNVSSVNLTSLVQWTIKVTNNGPDVATGVVVRDVLPESLIWVSDSGNYDHNSGEWIIGTLNKGTSAILKIITKVNKTGAIENGASVSGNQKDYDESNNYDSAIVDVNPAADLGIVKKVSDSAVNYNDVVRWTLIVTNYGPDAATGVVISDVLPEGFVYINSTRPYSNGKINIGNLAKGASVSVDIDTKVNVTGTFVNVASVKGNEFDHNLNNNKDNVSVFVKPAADLSVIKLVNNSSPDLLDVVEWTLTVRNNGPDVATGVVVRDVLPESLIWVRDSGNYNYNSGVWTVGTLNKGASASLKIVTRVNKTGNIVNHVSVSGNEFDFDMSNNNASRSVYVDPAADLGIVKLVSDSAVNYNDVVRWTLIVTNYGPDAATGVVISDVLPEGFVYINSTRPYSNGKINIGNLAKGASVSVDIDTKVNVTGTFVNVASVKGNEFDHNLNNNKDNVSVFVKPAADLSVIKLVNNSSPDLLDVVEWTLTVRNNGPDVATGVVVRDVLPESLIWVRDSGNYNYNSGVWTVGTLNKGASASLKIVTRVNKTGNIVNHVSVSGNEFDFDMSNNNASRSVYVNPAADLGIVKLVSNSVVNYTDVVRWTLIVTNYGPDAASGVKIYDTLPKGFIYINSTKKYSNGMIEIGSLAKGASVSVDIDTKVNVTGTFVNVASVKGNEYDHNPSNNKANVSILVKPASDLIVGKKVNNTKPNYNDLVTWTITVTNVGPDSASGVVVREMLPKSLIWINDSGLGKYDKNTGVWNIGSMNIGETKSLIITTLVNATGEVTNNVTVTGNEFDYNRSNNKDNETINVSKAADVEVIKFANSSYANYLQFIKWTVIAKNNGPDKANGIYIEEILPEGLKLIKYTATKGFYDNNMWAFCCLENGESQTLELLCQVTKTGTLTNIVTINANEYDPNKSNNKDNESILVPISSDLAIVKTVDESNPNYGDIVNWNITVYNNGPDDAYDVFVFDLMPEGLELLEYTASVGNYHDGTWIINNLANGESETLILRCLVKTLDEVENFANVVPSEYDWNESNNNDSEKISVNPIADLAVIKLVNDTNPNYLNLVKWTLIVTNYGPNDATGVTVSDVIPKGLKIVDVIGDGEYEDSLWYVGDLADGEYKQLDIICKVLTTGEVTNAAVIWANQDDPDLENNEDENYIDVPPASDISITKTVSKYQYSVGDLVKYSIRITNNGPDNAENIKVREIMDDNLLLKSFHASAGDFDKVNDVWSLDELDVGKDAILKINALAQKAGTAKNSVVAESDNYDPDLNNNNDTVKVNIFKKDKPDKNVYKKHNKQSNGDLREYSESILQKHVAGNPFMVLVLLFVFTMGAVYGKNILKKR